MTHWIALCCCFMLMLAIKLANVLVGHDVILDLSNQNGTNVKFMSKCSYGMWWYSDKHWLLSCVTLERIRFFSVFCPTVIQIRATITHVFNSYHCKVNSCLMFYCDAHKVVTSFQRWTLIIMHANFCFGLDQLNVNDFPMWRVEIHVSCK